MEGAMRTVRIVAVVFAVLGGMCAVLGYVTVIRDQGGSHTALAFVFTGVLATIGAALSALSHPRDAKEGFFNGRACPQCGSRTQENQALCPACGLRLSDPTLGSARSLYDGETVEEWRIEDDYEPRTKLLGAGIFWLGIIVLDVLFVLVVLWLFVPSITAAQTFSWSTGRPLGLVVLDIGFGFVLVGYSLVPSSALRL
jgi:hypothetical protein